MGRSVYSLLGDDTMWVKRSGVQKEFLHGGDLMASTKPSTAEGVQKNLGSGAMWVMVEDGPVIGLVQTSEVFKTLEVYGYIKWNCDVYDVDDRHDEK